MSRRDWIESELAKLRQESINRHAPFLYESEQVELMPTPAEIAARKYTESTARKCGVWDPCSFALNEQIRHRDGEWLFPRQEAA